MSSLNIWSRRNRCGGRCNTSPPHHRPISYLRRHLVSFSFSYTCAACAAPELSLYMGLCSTYACPSTKAFVLHMVMDVSVFKDLCYTCMCPSTRALWRNWMCLSTRACAAPVLVCLHAWALCCTAAPGHVCLQEPSQCCTCRCTLYTYSLQDTCSKQRNKL